MILNICNVFLNNKESKVNELKTLLTENQKTHNLTRYTFIKKLGFKNITKGLRRLDAFIEHPEHIFLKHKYTSNLIFRLILWMK